MKLLITAGAFIEGDGRTVWVNDAKGRCIGRFSKDGAQGDLAALWADFIAGMKRDHRIEVPEEFRPAFTRRAA